MSWLVGILPLLLPLLQGVANAWGSSTSGSLQKIAGLLANSAIVNELAAIGAALFPKLDPALHAAAAALLAAESHTGASAWVQGALNIAEQAAEAAAGHKNTVYFNPPLVIDGKWGPKSTAALEKFQAKLGLPVHGMFADAEYAALNAILAKA